MRQAIERLTRDGLVSPQRGRGTFVTGAPRDDRWLRVETTLQNLADVYRDTHPTILNIDESTRSPRLAESDGVAAPKYVYMRRIHAHQGRPYCVIDIYLDAEVFARHPARFRKETVIPLLMAMPSLRIARRARCSPSRPPTSRSRAIWRAGERAGGRGAARLHRAEAARHLSRRGDVPRRLRPRRIRPQVLRPPEGSLAAAATFATGCARIGDSHSVAPERTAAMDTRVYPNTQLYIDGAVDRTPRSGRTMPVVNPASGDTIGTLAYAERADLDHALDAADKGFADLEAGSAPTSARR